MKVFYFAVVILMFILACSKVEENPKTIESKEYVTPLDSTDRTYNKDL